MASKQLLERAQKVGVDPKQYGSLGATHPEFSRDVALAEATLSLRQPKAPAPK